MDAAGNKANEPYYSAYNPHGHTKYLAICFIIMFIFNKNKKHIWFFQEWKNESLYKNGNFLSFCEAWRYKYYISMCRGTSHI